MRIIQIISGFMIVLGTLAGLRGSGVLSAGIEHGAWLVVGVIVALVGLVLLHWTNMQGHSQH